MNQKVLWISLAVFVAWMGVSVLGALGTSEAAAAAGSGGRGKYLAELGRIIPADQVYVDSYIAGFKYFYPVPQEGIGVSLHLGHRQISSMGQEEIVHIGLQAAERAFQELPPLNIAFVIDRSGSMGERNKMDWVKKAFDVFIARVRTVDFVSLVVFSDSSRVLFSSTQMNTEEKRSRFRDAVWKIRPGGGTNLLAGLELGYAQVMANFRSEYTNRVLFLTDGLDNRDHSRQMYELAETNKKMGINVSTIGVGESFDLKLMDELARRGGGSSRFISDMKEMEEIFGSELDRMAVPAARNVQMKLEFLQKVQILGTWGYGNRIQGNTVYYSLPTLHHRDYETILAHVRLAAGQPAGRRPLARFSLTYEDLEGEARSQGPYDLDAEFVDLEYPVAGFSDGTVLKSGTMLRFAQTLQQIGQIYYGAGGDSTQLSRCLDLTVAMHKEMKNVRLRLDNQGFDDEIKILENYIHILGGDLALEDQDRTRIVEDVEIAPPMPQRSLQENLSSLFHEMLLDMNARQSGVIAVSGFVAKEQPQPKLAALLNEMGLVELAKAGRLKVVEREKLDSVLKEQELALSDLMDTNKAISVGKVLAAQYILTGSLIEMPSSVVIFSRIINVETTEVESAAQVIVPKSAEVMELL